MWQWSHINYLRYSNSHIINSTNCRFSSISWSFYIYINCPYTSIKSNFPTIFRSCLSSIWSVFFRTSKALLSSWRPTNNLSTFIRNWNNYIVKTRVNMYFTLCINFNFSFLGRECPNWLHWIFMTQFYVSLRQALFTLNCLRVGDKM